MLTRTYIIYRCLDGLFKIEENRGWACQTEQRQYTENAAQQKADEMNRELLVNFN